MKIDGVQVNKDFLQKLEGDLQLLLDQPMVDKKRPCPGCNVPCPCSGSRTCTCLCSQQCELVSKRLSSEPDRYPIEPKIVPLVFELYCLRVCKPCWSCEGHKLPSGEVHKLPRVWFITRSLVYPRIIADYIATLKKRRLLQNFWHICLAYSGNRFDTAFSIEPNLGIDPSPDLERLQIESKVIADGLVLGVRAQAQRNLAVVREAGKMAA